MNKTFTIEVTMKDRWIDDFCSLLKYMESCGKIGHSALIGFYADGDGDFRPKFQINTEFSYKHGIPKEKILDKPEAWFASFQLCTS